MDDVELTPSEREAFSRLAAAMPDNPLRPAAVRTLVRSRQRRRYAARAGLGVVAAAERSARASWSPTTAPPAPHTSLVATEPSDVTNRRRPLRPALPWRRPPPATIR